MRSEIKIALAAAFGVLVVVSVVWMTFRQGEKDTIPMDKSAMDATAGTGFEITLDAPDTRERQTPPVTTPALRPPRPEPSAVATPPPDRPLLRDATPESADAGRLAADTGTGDASPPIIRPADREPAPTLDSPGATAAPTLPPLQAPQEEPARTPPTRREEPQPTRTAETATVAVAPPRDQTPPAATTSTGTPAHGATPATYTIQEGDTLYKIAESIFGNGGQWRRIKEANPNIEETRLLVGTTLVIPPPGAAQPAAQPARPAESAAAQPERSTQARPGRATYVVGKGDSLILIARNVLKDGRRWREIYELNRDKLRSPDHIEPGMELALPEPR